MTEIAVSAAEANRTFSRLLRGVREGHRYVVTAHGRPVARLVPIDVTEAAELSIREAAKRALLKRTRSQPVIDVGPWTRDELYDR